MRCLERMLRRARLPMAHSQGFNPRPKVVFALALALGIGGVARSWSWSWPSRWSRPRCSAAWPPPPRPGSTGSRPRRSPGRPSQAEAVAMPWRSPPTAGTPPGPPWPPSSRARLALHPAPARPRHVAIDLRPFVLEADLDPQGVLRFRLKITPAARRGPRR